jgi:integrase
MRRQGVDKETFTSHGWRHAASTTLHELGYTPQAIEAQLAHTVGGVAGVYNKSLHLDERIKMMQTWADWLEDTNQGDKA